MAVLLALVLACPPMLLHIFHGEEEEHTDLCMHQEHEAHLHQWHPSCELSQAQASVFLTGSSPEAAGLPVSLAPCTFTELVQPSRTDTRFNISALRGPPQGPSL